MANDNMNFGVDLLPATTDTYNLGTSTKKWIINGVSSPSLTDTTYTFSGGTNKFTVTPLGGTAQDVTVTPSIANNITGSGTSGYLAKFNGTNTITSGPQLGSSTTTFLRNDGTWAEPTGGSEVLQSPNSTNTWHKILLTPSVGATSDGALAEETNSTVFSNLVSVAPQEGSIRAAAFFINSKVYMKWNSTDNCIDFQFV